MWRHCSDSPIDPHGMCAFPPCRIHQAPVALLLAVRLGTLRAIMGQLAAKDKQSVFTIDLFNHERFYSVFINQVLGI